MSKPKQIPRVVPAGAQPLTPLQMNNLHVQIPGRRSPIPPPRKPKQKD